MFVCVCIGVWTCVYNIVLLLEKNDKQQKYLAEKLLVHSKASSLDSIILKIIIKKVT